MNGDSRDVDYFGDPFLDSVMSIVRYLPFLGKCEHAFISSEACHMMKGRCLMLD